MMTTCHHCHAEFTPKRSTARYCSDAHRLAAHRGSLDRVRKAPDAPASGPPVPETLRNDQTLPPAKNRGMKR
jgi:hypothetical protein